MEIVNKKCVTADLKELCSYLYKNSNGFIEVSEWKNGEGYDINIDDKKFISLHLEELKMINYLCNVLDYGVKP